MKKELKNPKDDSSVEMSEQTTGAKTGRALEMVGLFFLELVKIALLAGLTIGLVRYFLFKPFVVNGQSMESSFFENEYLIIDELTYRFRLPQRGEVIVFESPVEPNDYYLKRIVGLPGERVKVAENKIIIYNSEHPQGIVLAENYLDIGIDTMGTKSFVLGEDQYFVLGDNRVASYDSRNFGPIDLASIVGRTFLRGYPITRIELFQTPDYNL